MKKALLIAAVVYLIFFGNILRPKYFFWSSDAESKHYPTRVYLYNSIVKEHRFPVWTERLFMGYPPYVDIENAYLNPVNLISIVLLGPVWSYKFIHFLTYLGGCAGFYYILKKRGYSLISYTATICAYYFSFFHLNHLIHLNIIAVSMLLPINIALADVYFSKPSKKLLVLQALVFTYGLLWGHPQTSILLAVAISMFVLITWKASIKAKVIYLALTFIMSAGLAMVQIYPSFRIFVDSQRVTGDIKFVDYSLTPELSLSYLYPYLYSSWSYYYGLETSSALTYVEFYNYVGIVAFVLFTIYILFSKRDKFYWFNYALIWVFVFLSYYNNIPLLQNVRLPLLDLFRYWTRSIILLSFALSLAAANVLNFNTLSTKNFKKGVLLFLAPVVLLTISYFILSDTPFVKQVHESLINLKFDRMLKRHMLIWAGLMISTLLLILLAAASKINKKMVSAIVLLLLIFDLRYFAQDILPVRLMKWFKQPRVTIEQEFYNKRILEEDDLLVHNQAMLFDAWAPYGNTLFLPDSYNNFFLQNNLGGRVRFSQVSETLRPELNLTQLRKYGFSAVTTKTQTFYTQTNSNVELIAENIESKYLIKKEGHIKISLNPDKNTTVHFSIKRDPNWIVTLNGNKITPDKWENIFMSAPIPRGENIIEFYYFPKDIFIGLVFGSLMVIGSVFSMRFYFRLFKF